MKRVAFIFLFVLMMVSMVGCGTRGTRSDLHDYMIDLEEYDDEVLTGEEFNDEYGVDDLVLKGNYKEINYDDTYVSYRVLFEVGVIYLRIDFEDEGNNIYISRISLSYININKEVSIEIESWDDLLNIEIEDIETFAKDIFEIDHKDIEWILLELGYSEIK